VRDIDLPELFEANRNWAASMVAAEPSFFTDLEHEQRPAYLWIGCSDSRVPANQIVGLRPGGVFVHRNIGNLVVHTDLNCLSVLQYAVDVLEVRHVIVTGHYGCGAIAAALDGASLGLIDNWLRHIQDIANEHGEELAARADPADRANRLCELNVATQVANVCRTTIVQDAWNRGQELAIHGWIYHLHDGLLRDLNVTTTGVENA
jgi:carbonic anhydrase